MHVFECSVFLSQNPRDFYVVGNTVEYSCIDGHYLSGDAVAQCTENQMWRTGAMVCKSTSSLHSARVVMYLGLLFVH